MVYMHISLKFKLIHEGSTPICPLFFFYLPSLIDKEIKAQKIHLFKPLRGLLLRRNFHPELEASPRVKTGFVVHNSSFQDAQL